MAAYPTSSGPMLEHRGHPLARREQPALRAAHRLRRRRGARREQQRPQDIRLALRPRAMRPELVARPRPLPGALERIVQRLTHRHGRIVGVGEARRRRGCRPAGPDPSSDGLEQRLVAGLGDQELHVGVRDVASEVLVAPGVVQPDQRRSHEPRTTQREHVVRGVVEEHGDVGRAIGVEPGAVQRGESLGFEQKLSVRPHLVAETKRGAAGVARRRAPLRLRRAATFRAGRGTSPRGGASATRSATSAIPASDAAPHSVSGSDATAPCIAIPLPADQIRSRIVPVARPPPQHIEMSARLPSRRSSSCRAVVMSRLPVAPTG